MCALKSIFKELPTFLNSFFHTGSVPKGSYLPVLSLLNFASLKAIGGFSLGFGEVLLLLFVV